MLSDTMQIDPNGPKLAKIVRPAKSSADKVRPGVSAHVYETTDRSDRLAKRTKQDYLKVLEFWRKQIGTLRADEIDQAPRVGLT